MTTLRAVWIVMCLGFAAIDLIVGQELAAGLFILSAATAYLPILMERRAAEQAARDAEQLRRESL